MQHTGGQGATVAARGRFSVEWLPPASAGARPAESHLSHLSHLIPANPALKICVLRVSRLWHGLRTSATLLRARDLSGAGDAGSRLRRPCYDMRMAGVAGAAARRRGAPV